MNDLTEEENEILKFPMSYDDKIWEVYLERKLDVVDMSILTNYENECEMNKMLKEIYKKCEKQDLCIALLTYIDGNCLFESLVCLGIGETIANLRKGIASVMYLFRDYEYFFPYQKDTIKQLFNNHERIHVCCKRKNKVIDYIDYSYEIMCQDLCNNGTWHRMPTNLILMVISLLFKLDIKIINDQNNHMLSINVYNEEATEDNDIREIILANLGELHYVPLEKIGDDEELDPIYYNDDKGNFIKWAISMENKKKKKYLRAKKKESRVCIKEPKEEEKKEPSEKFEDFNIELISS